MKLFIRKFLSMGKFRAGTILVMSSAVWMIFIRFANANMSETRLFVEFWWQWLIIALMMFLGGYLVIEG
jgi:hypothetical protein